MALTGPMDITFNDNMQSIIKDLPVELKNIVFSYIDIKKLVSYDATIEPFIDAYIKHFIDGQLFTNASMFQFFMNAHLFTPNAHYAHYGKTIEWKIYNMATVWAEDFINQCDILEDDPRTGVCFNIKYNWRFCSNYMNMKNPPPLKTAIEYFPNVHNSFNIISDRIDMNHCVLPQTKILRCDRVISEMLDSICFFMTRPVSVDYSGVSKIHSIELVKKYRLSTIDDNADVPFYKKYRSSGMDNGIYADGQIIKKYY
jgi:hypothetical protein